MRCHACLVEKDDQVLERYPYGDSIVREPISPLVTIDVEPDEGDDWRSVALCHKCYHAIDADMWVSQACLRRIECKTPFTELPKMAQ